MKIPNDIWLTAEELYQRGYGHHPKHIYPNDEVKMEHYIHSNRVVEMLKEAVKDGYTDGYFDVHGGLPYNKSDDCMDYIKTTFPELKGKENKIPYELRNMPKSEEGGKQ
jgi:hypothetical protein